VVGYNSVSKMYVYARCFVQCCAAHMKLNCWFCGPGEGVFYAYAYKVCINSECTIQRYVRILTHCVRRAPTGLIVIIKLGSLIDVHQTDDPSQLRLHFDESVLPSSDCFYRTALNMEARSCFETLVAYMALYPRRISCINRRCRHHEARTAALTLVT
jgi:hypothetical protein